MKKTPLISIRLLAFIAGILASGLGYQANAAVSYWDPEGAQAGVYTTGSLAGTWDNTSAKWSASSGGGSLTTWVDGNAACFAVGAGCTNSGSTNTTTTFTITLNSTRTIGGIFDGALNPLSAIITISGSGSLNLASGFDAFAPANSSDSSLGQFTVGVPMTGPGTLTAEYNGQMFLHGANTYTGGTQLGFPGVSAFTGIINFNNANAFGTGGITNMFTGSGTINCGLVQEGTSAMTIANPFAFAATNSTVNIVGAAAGLTMSGPLYLTGSCTNANLETGQAGNLLIISGAISGTAQKFNKLNPGTLRLAGANTYNAITTISNGTVQIANASALPTQTGAGSIILESPGILDVFGSSPTATNLTQSSTGGIITNSTGAGTLTLAISTANLLFNGKIQDTVATPLSIVKTGTGTMILSNTAYNGSTTVNAGTLLFTNVNAQVGAGAVTDNGAITFAYSNGTVTAASAISGTGNITKTGVGTLILTGANSYNGTTVSTGTLQAGNGGTSGTLGAGNVTNNATTTINRSDAPTVANNFSGSGTLNVNGSGNVTLSGSMTGTGPLNISGAGNVTVSGFIGGTGTTTVSSSGNTLISGAITNTGALTKSGAATLTLSGVNTYTGATAINAGTLLANSPGALSIGSMYIVTNGAILDLASNDFTVAAILGTGVISNMTGTLTVSTNAITGAVQTTYSALSGSIVGPGTTLVKSGTAAMALRGPSSFTGSTLNINGGTVSVGGGGAANGVSTSTAVSVSSGAALELDGVAATVGSLSGAGFVNLGGGTLTVNDSANTTFSGTIRDSDFSGWTPGSGNGLRGYYFNNIDFTSPNVIRDDSQIYSVDMSFLPGFVAGSSKSNNVSVRWVGKLLTTSTAGTYTIGTRTDDGSRLWLNGQLVIDDWTGHGATTRSTNLTLAANTQYDLIMEYYNGAQSGSATLWWTPPGGSSNLISGANLVLPGAGSLVKSGTGTLTLSGANSYAGTTVVNGGTLFVANSTGSATSTNTVTVNSTGTIAGNGTIAGVLTLNNGGTISPGASPGTITTADEVWNGGGQYLVQMNASLGTQGADPGWDYIHVTGALTISSTSASRFVIKLASLDLSDNAAPCSDFNTSGFGNAWTILTADGGINGFDASKFTVDYSGFSPIGVGGGFGVVTNGNSIQLVYNAAPSVSSNPTPVVASKGGTATFNITAAGSPPLDYQWLKGGVGLSNGSQSTGATVSGATTTALTISGVSYLDEAGYSCVVTGTGSATSSAATLTVIDPPVVTSPTTSSTVVKNAGDAWILSVTTSGRPATAYQWKKGGVNLANGAAANRSTISGSTTPSLTLTGVFAADNGNYTVSVTNSDGNTTSVATTLAVNDPIIVTQPVNSTFECGSTSCISVSAVGSTNFTYQWYTPDPSGTKIAGATNANLCFTNIHSLSAGSYSVVVSNVYGGSITSQVAVVTIRDTTAPVVTLNGLADVTAECHGSYLDPGASVADACDGNSTISAPTSGSANLNVLGDYTVTYTASDSSTNAGNSVTRVIHVRDTTPPVVTLTNSTLITTECHNVYVEPGASANDACAGSLPVSYLGTVDTNTVGFYTLTYSAIDGSNNSNGVTRVVHVIDTTPPVIALISGANTVHLGDAYTDPGATATDTCSATVTIITNGSVDINALGSYTLTYTATDASANSTTTNRVVQVTPVPVAITAISTITSAVKIPDGTNVQFSVTTTGSDPKTYIWYVKDVADTGPGLPILTNNTATATNLAVAVKRSGTGNPIIETNVYYVVVDNAAVAPATSPTTNVTIVLDNTPPTVGVTLPKKGKAYGQAGFVVSGNAQDHKGHVAHVYYRYVNLNPGVNLNPMPVADTNSPIYEATLNYAMVNGATNYSSVTSWTGTQPPPLPGTNNVIVWTTDLAGNANDPILHTNVIQFFYEIPMPFNLNKIGDGSGTVSWKGVWKDKGEVQFGTNTPQSQSIPLNVGETYTLTYKPDTLNGLSKAPAPVGTNIVVSVITNTAGMGFDTNSTKKWVGVPSITVQSNLTSGALEFDRDRFFDMQGTYNGLFSVDNTPSASSCGSVSLRLSKTGTVTGQIMVQGVAQHLKASACNAAGQFTNQTTGTPGPGVYTVIGTVQWSDSQQLAAEQIKGTVAPASGWTATMVADKARKDLFPTGGAATMAINDCSGIAEAGSAIGTIALDSVHGKAKVKLIVPDVSAKAGKTLTVQVNGSKSGNIPVYAFYQPTHKTAEAVILGYLNGHDSNITTNGAFTWLKTGGSGDYYNGGFTNGSAPVQLSPYTSGGLLAAQPNNYSLVIGGGAQSDLTFTVDQGLTKIGTLPTNIYSATFPNIPDGTVKITYGIGTRTHTWQANGVILQNVNEVRGFLLNATTTPGATASGKLTVDPIP